MRTVPDMDEGWVTGWRFYTQIAERLRHRITTGAYSAGSALPSEASLSAEFRVARNTIRRALGILETEGLIVTVPSKGRIVRTADEQATPVYRYQVIAHDI